MDDKTRFESDFGIDLFSGSAGIEKAIEMGIQIENEGNRFYTEKASQVKIPQVRHHLSRLAEDETDHASMLKELKQSLSERGEWIGAKETPDMRERLEELGAFKPEKDGPRIEGTSSAIEVLNEALKLEERTRDFYKSLANELKNDKGRGFFEKLAEWEQSHCEIVTKLRDMVMDMSGTWS